MASMSHPRHARVTIGELGPAWLDRQQGHMKPTWLSDLRERLAGTRGAQVGTDPHR